MRIIQVDEIQQGMILAREIIDVENGRVLLGVGATNLSQYLNRFQAMGLNYLYVEDAASADLELQPGVKGELRFHAEEALEKVFEKLRVGQQPEYQTVKYMVQELVQYILDNPEIMINVYELRSKGGDFLGHCINVAFLSLLMGTSLRYDEEKLRNLGIGALLHDIGFSGLPQSLLRKGNNLSMEEKCLYEQHPVIGYHKVKDSWEISPSARNVILSHHERSDGSGYPRRLLKGDIHEFSRIVGLADCFEDLSGGHPFSLRMKIQDAVELLQVEADRWFDETLVQSFTSLIPFCPNGSTVRLSDGTLAVVIGQNKGFPARPVVRIFQDAEGKPDPSLKTVDLLRSNHLVIE